MATLDEIVTAIQTALVGIDVASIPPSPPENIGAPQLPALIVYPADGGVRIETAYAADGNPEKSGAHTINADLHINWDNLPVNVAAATPLVEPIVNALVLGFLNGRFGNTVTTLGADQKFPLRYALVRMGWGGRKTVGYRFQIDVVANSAVV
jgi:hypothetical protein